MSLSVFFLDIQLIQLMVILFYIFFEEFSFILKWQCILPLWWHFMRFYEVLEDVIFPQPYFLYFLCWNLFSNSVSAETAVPFAELFPSNSLLCTIPLFFRTFAILPYYKVFLFSSVIYKFFKHHDFNLFSCLFFQHCVYSYAKYIVNKCQLEYIKYYYFI